MAEEKKTSTAPEKAKSEKAKADKSKDKKKKSKNNPFKSTASFFKSVKAEGKKVVWSSAKDVVRNTIIVIIVVTIVGAAIYGVDTLLSLGMKQIKKAADKQETTVASQQVDPNSLLGDIEGLDIEGATEAETPTEAEAPSSAE